MDESKTSLSYSSDAIHVTSKSATKPIRFWSTQGELPWSLSGVLSPTVRVLTIKKKLFRNHQKWFFGLRTPKLVQSRLIAFLTAYHHDPWKKVFKSQDIRILKISIVTCLKLSTHTCIGESPNWPK